MSPTKPGRAFRKGSISGAFGRSVSPAPPAVKGVIDGGMEIVWPTKSRAFRTLYIDGTHVVAGFGAHEMPAAGASIALPVAMDRESIYCTDSGRAVCSQRRSAGKKRKSNDIIPPDD